MVNVLDYGAVGDGVADDTAAIQAAINASNSEVFFPKPSAFYKTTSALTPKPTTLLFGEGYGAEIRGDFNGWIIDRPYTGGYSAAGGPFVMQWLHVRNTHATGGCVRLSGLITPVIEGCWFHAYQGLYAQANIFSGEVRESYFQGLVGFPSGSIGLAGVGFAVSSCDFVGWENGIRAWGSWGGARTSRFEVNKVGVRLGVDYTGTNSAALGSSIDGCTFEANDNGLDMHLAYGCKVGGIFIQGTTNAPSGLSVKGLRTAVIKTCQISAVQIGGSGGFSQAAVDISYPPEKCTFDAISASNAQSGIDVWRKPSSMTWADLIPFMRQCNQPTT